MYKATKEFRFEMAHVLSNYKGPCGNLHGHSYRCLITLESVVLKDGMVKDFSEIKKLVGENIIDKMDHSLAVNEKSDDKFEQQLTLLCMKFYKKIIIFPFRTTAENMARYIYEAVNNLFDLNHIDCVCSKVQLYETTTGCAEYSE